MESRGLLSRVVVLCVMLGASFALAQPAPTPTPTPTAFTPAIDAQLLACHKAYLQDIAGETRCIRHMLLGNADFIRSNCDMAPSPSDRDDSWCGCAFHRDISVYSPESLCESGGECSTQRGSGRWTAAARECFNRVRTDANNRAEFLYNSERSGSAFLGAIEANGKANFEKMSKYTNVGRVKFEFKPPLCEETSNTAGVSVGSSNTAVSVRGLVCTNDKTSYSTFAARATTPDGLRQAVARLVLRDFITDVTRYYLGAEFNAGTGQFTPVKVPVCNLAASEGAADTGNTNWVKNIVGANHTPGAARTGSRYDPQFKDYWSCGTPCTFEQKNYRFNSADGRELQALVPRDGTCTKEYAYFRGIWPHVLWKNTHDILNDILRDGTLNFTTDEEGNSPCTPLSQDIEPVNTALHVLDDRITAIMAANNGSGRLPQVNCRKGGAVLTKLDGTLQGSELDKLINTRTGSGETNEGTDFRTNNAICLLESARVLQIRAFSKIVSCEATWRSQVAFATKVTNPETIKTAVSNLQTTMRNDSACQLHDGFNFEEQQCADAYVRNMKGWFCKEFYNPSIGFAADNNTCQSPIEQMPMQYLNNQEISCMFNPKNRNCPGAPSPAASPTPRALSEGE